MRKLTLLSLSVSLMVVPANPALASKPNPHNLKDCDFCHAATPRFGVDTRDTVTFKEVAPDDPALCLRCHAPEENLHPLGVKMGGMETPAPKDLPLGAGGDVEGTVVCTTCHFVHAADADHALLRGFPGSQNPAAYGKWQDLCRACHGKDLEERSPHAGNEKGCVFCHQATPKKGDRPAVAARGVDLCNFCHGGIQDGHFDRANPFEGKVTCDSCHDPHLGVDSPGRLSGGYVTAAAASPVIDPHYRKTLCFTCHTDDKGPTLLTGDGTELCNRCHASGLISGDPHPLRKLPDGWKPPEGWPLREGSLTCLTCHRAGHREDKPFPKFLRGGPYADPNDVCFQCHRKEDFASRNPHADINQLQGCEFCHAGKPTPGKDSRDKVRLLADPAVLCRRCHEPGPHPGNFDHTILLTPERAASVSRELPLGPNRRVDCPTCHNPHVAEVDDFKLRAGGGMMICSGCHRY